MTTITASAANAECTPAERVTRSLLGYGIIAGPMYVLISLVHAVTRDGFDLRRHQWSLLANGSFGWIQIANFVLSDDDHRRGRWITVVLAHGPRLTVGSAPHRRLRGEPDRRRSVPG